MARRDPDPPTTERPTRRAAPRASPGLLRGFPLAAVALALAGCAALTSGVPLDEAVSLAAQGGEAGLRSPMRPIRGTERVLVITLDGLSDEALRRALDEGRLPALSALLGPRTGARTWAHGYAAPDVVTTLPSSTIPAWTTLATGAPPARTGVVGNEWFDRSERRFHAPIPVSVTSRSHLLRTYDGDWLARQIRTPTLFERAGLRAHVSSFPVHHGADLLTTPSGLDVFQVLSVFPESLFGDRSLAVEAYIEIDEESVDELLDGFADHGIPDLQVAHFAGVDLVAHASDAPLHAQQRHLAEVVAPGLARILAAYREAGVLDRTHVVVVSDHGQTPVPADPANALGTDPDTDPPAVLRALGFRVRAPALTVEREDHSAVLAYQGGLAYVYLADRSTCPEVGDRCDWSAPPRFEEDVLPVAEAFLNAGRYGDPVPALRGRLAMVLARRPVGLGKPPEPFAVYDGRELVPVREHLRAHPRPDWIDLDRRLRGLAVGPHGHLAGDVMLVSRLSPATPFEERTYFADPSHSWHGGPSRLDSVVPLLVARPGGSGAALGRRVERVLGPERTTARVTPLVLELLGHRASATRRRGSRAVERRHEGSGRTSGWTRRRDQRLRVAAPSQVPVRSIRSAIPSTSSRR